MKKRSSILFVEDILVSLQKIKRYLTDAGFGGDLENCAH